ncbi:MAG: patatin-like phospholipase family protein [Spirochaetota bacterium]
MNIGKAIWKTFGLGPRRFGLALGGGAARGFTHIGVLRALEEAELAPSVVAGTSAGSLVGALYCAGFDSRRIEEEARNMKWGGLIQITFPRMDLVKADKLSNLVRELIGDMNISDLKIPFAAVAVDLVSGEERVLRAGPVSTAVRASCGIPGVFVPLEHGGELLVDGGIRNSVPSNVVRSLGADFVVGVDLNSDNVGQDESIDNVVDVLARTMGILMYATSDTGRRNSDIFLQPDLVGFSYHSMSRIDEAIARGYETMVKIVPRLKEMFAEKN